MSDIPKWLNMADWSDMPDVYVTKAECQQGMFWRIEACSVPMVMLPEVRLIRADIARAELEAAVAAERERMGPIADILPDAVIAAEKAMLKFPQPNYVISKWAEETGEVTKDLIHVAEGRQTFEKLRGEIVQSLAMLHRLLVEGDQIHGLPPIAPALQENADE